MKQAYIKYNQNGFACLPTLQTKAPQEKTKWNDGFSEKYFDGAYGIGIICGKISGGLECFDFDNHQKDATENLGKFLAIPEIKAIHEKHNFPIEKTVSGGYHLLFKCEKNEGNRKLAQRFVNGRPDAFIETKGEGGYFCADPTPGYKVIRNDIFNTPTISEYERSVLFQVAISMNEYFPVIKNEYESTERPGDLYNENIDSISEMKSILINAGWGELGGMKWRRPGKTEGISATLGKVASNVFYCFTANGYPFESMKAYTPFQVLALLKYNGDFKEAAKSIAPEKTAHTVHEQKTKTLQISEIEKILLGAKIDTSKRIEKPPVILSVKEQEATSWIYKRVFTLGNFSCIIGKAKSRKTFLLSLITASMLSSDKTGKFVGEMTIGKNNILYFDTEQGDYDSQNVIRRIEKMAGNTTHLSGYSLRPFSPNERCQIIEHAFKLFGEKTGLCVIDGIADLAFAINDEEEASRVTTFLLRMSKVYNCHISTVIHQNKNDNFATGHLGSSIMKKAEVIISVTKKEDASEVNCDMIRGSADFKPFDIIINDEGIPIVRDGCSRKQERKPAYVIDEKPLLTYAERDIDVFTSGEIPNNLGF